MRASTERGRALKSVVTRRTPVSELPELLRVPEVAAFCDCSAGTIYEAIRCGELKAIKLGRLTRISRATVENWLHTEERTAS